ncbi:MAG: inositol monophosphatase [Verrucomicrobia bacterium]|nr:inositol monophosphatase [Verrucomicrobiota bacterium]MBI3868337.1 inositol monophosphatase [Verrucomicrobiota bacterium]
MNDISRTEALDAAVEAAKAAGHIMRKNLVSTRKRINEATQHDIKLELDVRCQKLIERRLSKVHRGVAILGEEGVSGDPKARTRWVIDPIDGTVNFTYGIPHACVSIALEERIDVSTRFGPAYQAVVGVVYDPFCDELWTAVRGRPALLNGRRIHVSARKRLDEAIVSLGFAKQKSTLNRMLPNFVHLVHRVRKIRIMGSAALAMVYVASGRLDAYLEYGVRLWDVAAGGLILEMAGGDFRREQVSSDLTHRVLANNGPMGHLLRRYY